MQAFLGPAIKYIKSSNKVRGLVTSAINKVKELRGKDTTKTGAVPSFMARDLEHIQEDINATYQMLGIMTVFGVHVPLLYALAMCYVITQTLCVSHVAKAEKADCKTSNHDPATIMIRHPVGPSFLYIIIAYLFASWYAWDNMIPYRQVIYCWPAVVIGLVIWTAWSFGISMNRGCMDIFKTGTSFSDSND